MPNTPPPWQPSQASSPGAQPRFGTTYGGLGAFDNPPKPKRSRKPVLAAVAVVVVVAGGGAAAWLLGLFHGDVLDQKAVQDGVQQVLRQDFGESDVRDVSCPADQPVKSGTTFDCSVTVAGQPKKVTIRVLNDSAQYEVGAPK